MTSYADMDAVELRHTLDYWNGQVCKHSRELLEAMDAGDWAWQIGLRSLLRQDLAQVRRIHHLLQLGAVA